MHLFALSARTSSCAMCGASRMRRVLLLATASRHVSHKFDNHTTNYKLNTNIDTNVNISNNDSSTNNQHNSVLVCSEMPRDARPRRCLGLMSLLTSFQTGSGQTFFAEVPQYTIIMT